MTIKFSLLSLGFTLLVNQLAHNNVYAETINADNNTDVIVMASRSSKLDIRDKYNNEILKQALELSVDKYGPYKIIMKPISMPTNVTFYELSRGHIINTSMSGATPDKDHLAIPIRIPVRRGILNYRLLVVNKNKLDFFNKITSTAQLKKLTLGMHSNSVTAEILTALGFTIVEGAGYDGMFKQLSLGRFDYIPRGVHEAYDELTLRKDTIDNLVIEPNLALYIPMPYYIYVSPAFPKIAERLTYGLEKMVEQQLIKSIFDRYYAEDIKRANLAERTIIDIGNPFLSPETPFHRKELWIEEFAIKASKNALR